MDDRSHMTIDPRIPTMPGRDTSGFHRHYLHQARSAVRGLASRMNGELHPTENRLWGGLTYGWHLLRVNLFSNVVTSRESENSTMWLPLGYLTINTSRYVIRPFPFEGWRFPTPHKRSNSTTICDRPPKKQTSITVPLLSRSSSERHVLQCRWQPTATQPIQKIQGSPSGCR